MKNLKCILFLLLLVCSGSVLAQVDKTKIPLKRIQGINETLTTEEVNKLDGFLGTTLELNRATVGVKSNIQAQADSIKNAMNNYTETDPSVSSWAKQATKPTYTSSEVGLGNVTNESKATMFTNPAFTTGITTPAITLGATAITATAAELNYVDGVTGAIQPQLGTKVDTTDIVTGSWYSDAEIDSFIYNKAEIDAIIESLFTGYLRSNGLVYRVQRDSIVPPTWISLGFNTDLISYIDFEETSGTSFNNSVLTSNDASVLSGNITINQLGKIGKAVYTDGTGRISTAEQASLITPAAFSYSFWTKPTTLADKELYALFDVSSSWIAVNLKSTGAVSLHLRSMVSPTFDTQTVSVSTPILVNQWNHIVVTYNNVVGKLYVNNVEVVSIDYANGFVTTAMDNPQQLWCGAAGFVGYFDQTAIWNRVLSTNDMISLYNLGQLGIGK